jgi:hypothetical protein
MYTTMKKETIALTGIVLLGMLLFSGCQQGINDPSDDPGEDRLFANAGEIHNQMIAYYYANRTETLSGGTMPVDELVDLSFDYLATLGYDASATSDIKSQLKRKFSGSSLKFSDHRGFSTDPSTFIPQLESTGLYSEQFLEEIDAILQLAHQHKGKKAIREYVNAEFRGFGFATERDTEAQQLFINIFNGSYQYWEASGDSGLKSTLLKDSSWVIINDGIGGILGSIFGPIGSIVTATVFSVGTNEEIKR